MTMKKRINPMLFVAGIGIGIFGYSMFLASRESKISRALEQAIVSQALVTDDVSELRARLAASQKRVTRLESMITMATAAENKLQQIKDPENAGANQIDNLETLIDRSKPLLRALILPELEKSMADGDFGGNFRLNYWSDLLELNPDQQERLQAELDLLARARADTFMEQLKDDETSMFALFNQMNELENIVDPEVDAIYANHLDAEQLNDYQEKRLEQRANIVDAEAANTLDRINYHIPDLNESQQDEIYAVLSRSSKAYTPEMQIATGDTVRSDSGPLNREQRTEAIESILQPHQLSDWKTYRNREELLSGIGP